MGNLHEIFLTARYKQASVGAVKAPLVGATLGVLAVGAGLFSAGLHVGKGLAGGVSNLVGGVKDVGRAIKVLEAAADPISSTSRSCMCCRFLDYLCRQGRRPRHKSGMNPWWAWRMKETQEHQSTLHQKRRNPKRKCLQSGKASSAPLSAW